MLAKIDNYNTSEALGLEAHNAFNGQSSADLAHLDLDSIILAATLKPVGDAVIATDSSGRISQLNLAAENLTGWPQAEAIGHPVDEIFNIINAETRQPVLAPALRTIAQGLTLKLPEHSLLVSRDGNEHAVCDCCAPIINANNEIEGAVIVFHDLTEQVSVQAALHASEQLFRTPFENASVGIAHVACNGQLLRINHQFSRMAGYSVAELLFDKYQKITHPDDLAENVAGYERMLANNEIDSFSMEKRYIRKDKSILWANLEVGCVRDANHEIQYFIVLVEDISARKQTIEDSRRFSSLSMEKRDRRKDKSIL